MQAGEIDQLGIEAGFEARVEELIELARIHIGKIAWYRRRQR